MCCVLLQCDIYSLGVIFFELYQCVTTEMEHHKQFAASLDICVLTLLPFVTLYIFVDHQSVTWCVVFCCSVISTAWGWYSLSCISALPRRWNVTNRSKTCEPASYLQSSAITGHLRWVEILLSDRLSFRNKYFIFILSAKKKLK